MKSTTMVAGDNFVLTVRDTKGGGFIELNAPNTGEIRVYLPPGADRLVLTGWAWQGSKRLDEADPSEEGTGAETLDIA